MNLAFAPVGAGSFSTRASDFTRSISAAWAFARSCPAPTPSCRSPPARLVRRIVRHRPAHQGGVRHDDALVVRRIQRGGKYLHLFHLSLDARAIDHVARLERTEDNDEKAGGEVRQPAASDPTPRISPLFQSSWKKSMSPLSRHLFKTVDSPFAPFLGNSQGNHLGTSVAKSRCVGGSEHSGPPKQFSECHEKSQPPTRRRHRRMPLRGFDPLHAMAFAAGPASSAHGGSRATRRSSRHQCSDPAGRCSEHRHTNGDSWSCP